MGRYSELIQKEVINVQDGSVLGCIRDMEMDYGSGTVRSIILQEEGRFLGFLGSCSEWVIPWRCIAKIGDDIILVDIDLTRCRRDSNR